MRQKCLKNRTRRGKACLARGRYGTNTDKNNKKFCNLVKTNRKIYVNSTTGMARHAPTRFHKQQKTKQQDNFFKIITRNIMFISQLFYNFMGIPQEFLRYCILQNFNYPRKDLVHEK